jgi:cytochrome c2
MVGGQGGTDGPALDGVADRLDADYLRKWVADPSSIKPDSKMPPLGLQGEQLEEILTFLATLTEKE